jgi:hypothetical protein
METSLDWFIYFINFNFIEMVIVICVLGVLLAYSFGWNVWYFVKGVKGYNDIQLKNYELAEQFLDLRNKLKDSEENRTLKANRINDLIKSEQLLKDQIAECQQKNKDCTEMYSLVLEEAVRYKKIGQRMERELSENNKFVWEKVALVESVKNYQKILKKYLDYAGYKHLDIKWTKKEKQILKNLEK